MAALATALMLPSATVARGQMGQAAMAPTGGLANRAVQGFQELNQNGPGFLYYGINAADRGLGYRGSYMTLGGYIPGFEDDLGGLWAADLRGHLSVYGGFFSNVGAVRKQFLGGSLLGIGVYWDYDGDLNQYSDSGVPGTAFVFPGGQVYNQVGVSAEWLTDFGNIRSNGYIPVGTTAQYVGPFVENFVLCQNGVNAGLAGSDLEVGAYIPGLSDWAGMISVGGYAYGNARYNFPNGQDVVPWFGGVYTRLDMTFIENWDFSLQYNNDSYFDSTGFARLTYRMGGSRRRNVPDQMEQPMMRNEHVVRAHQTPEVAVNPETGTPWRVFHVDNSGSGAGAGTAAAPFTSLAAAQAAATTPYDIVYVHQGSSATNPYVTPAAGYALGAPNQYFIGEGSNLTIPTLSCGSRSFFAGSGGGAYPILTNPLGTAIVVNQPGSVVSHFLIQGSQVGIGDGASGMASGVANISDVIIVGGGPGQRGVEIRNSTGTFAFDRLQLVGLTNDGFVLSADGGNVSVSNSSFTNIEGRAFAVTGDNAFGVVTSSSFSKNTGVAVEAAGTGSRIVLASSTVADTIGVAVRASGVATAIQVADSRIVSSGSIATDSAIVASGTGAVVGLQRSVIVRTGSDAVVASGEGSVIMATASTIDQAGNHGVLVSGQAAQFYMTGSSSITNSEVDGVRLIGENAKLLVQESTIINSGGDGVGVYGTVTSTASQATILRSTIRQSGVSGIQATNLNGTNEVVQVYGSSINGAVFAGISALNANVDVDRDPTVRNGTLSSILNTGLFGVTVDGDSAISVRRATISAVNVGIDATNAIGTTNLTASNNTIVTSGSGTGVAISGDVDAPSRVRAQVLANRITTAGGVGITLTTVNPPAAPAANPKMIAISDAANAVDLGVRNFGTGVTETPVPNPGATPPQPTLIQWGAAAPPLPPSPPIITAP